MDAIRFTKAHGLGNDFIIVDDREERIHDGAVLAPRLCHRRTGIGADGLMLVRRSADCDARMVLYNADGSEAEMCGNGIRCFARYVFDRGLAGADMTVETPAGVMRPIVSEKDGATVVRVDMGRPSFDRAAIPMTGEGECINEKLTVGGETYDYSTILLGVPHAVVFVPDVGAVDVCALGPVIEMLPQYPRHANVNFTQVLDASTVAVRTWERGCGATLACGTGSSSAAVCSALAGRTGRSVDVRLALGTLHIDWADDGAVFMTGPAEYSFEGVFQR